MSTPAERREVLEVFMARLRKDFPKTRSAVLKAQAKRMVREFFNDRRAGLIPAPPVEDK